MAAQRGGKELEEGSDRLPLVIRIKGHRVWEVTPKASSGCHHVDQCDAYRASAWRCAAAGGMSSRVARSCHLDNPPSGTANATLAGRRDVRGRG
jgi:hypothetical protein